MKSPPVAQRMYLTGFMASGKSTVGPLVADRLDWHFLDLDHLVESRAGRPVEEIFAQSGEGEFRRLEADALRSTSDREGLVVATGGGALVQEDALQWALARGLVIYLQVSSPVLADRLRSEAAHRPLLQDDDDSPLQGTGLTERIERLLAEREAQYRRAHATVLAEAAPEEVAEAVLAATQAYALR